MKIIYENKDSYDVEKALVLWRRDELDDSLKNLMTVATFITNALSVDVVNAIERYNVDNAAEDSGALIFTRFMQYYNVVIHYLQSIKVNSLEWVDLTKFDTRFDDVSDVDQYMKSLVDRNIVDNVINVADKFACVIQWLNYSSKRSGAGEFIEMSKISRLYESLGIEYNYVTLDYDSLLSSVISVLVKDTLALEDYDE